jgi:spore coat polysaccharide biosynthesis protein SpsF
MPTHTLAIIQARMSSTRLPGKVLKDIAGKPMLQHVVERARQAKTIDEVLVATTSESSDDILGQYCQEQSIPCYRGSPLDVLDRFYHAAMKYQPQLIIRLTADCPLLDPNLIDLSVGAFLGKDVNRMPMNPPLLQVDYSQAVFSFDFVANRLPPPWKRSLPIGLDVEVCSFNALQRAWQQADKAHQREHVMPYLYEGVVFSSPNILPDAEWYLEQGTSPLGFKVALLNHIPDYGALRWTVDTPADLQFVRQVYTHIPDQTLFGWQQVLNLIEQHPELASINAQVKHKSAFDIDNRNTSS